jgi:hypothetical protein
MNAEAALKLLELSNHPKTETILKGRHTMMKVQKFSDEKYNRQQIKRKLIGFGGDAIDKEKNQSEAIKK